MPRELLIMRHAKSAWNTNASSDFERPLNKRGETTAPRMGQWLKQQGLVPDCVLCSTAKRAKQTIQRVCPELGFDVNQISWQAGIYEASVGDLLKALTACPDNAQRTLLVGHNPGLEMLVAYLCADSLGDDDGHMPTAAVAHLEISTTWAELDDRSGRLLSINRPRLLFTE